MNHYETRPITEHAYLPVEAQLSGISVTSGRLVTVKHGPYLITLELSSDGKFRNVVGVATSRDFRSMEQRLKNAVYHDVDQFYID